MKFSLLSLLLFAAVVGLSIALWMTRQENENLRVEVRGLKHEEIKAKKANLPIVRKLPTHEPLTWRYRIYLPPGKLQPGGAWVLCTKYPSGGGEQARLEAGTVDITMKVTEDPVPGGGSEWHLNIGDRYRTERLEISAETAEQFREEYKWTLSPQESELAPNSPFIGLLKSEEVAIWIAPNLANDIVVPYPDTRWLDQPVTKEDGPFFGRD